MVTTEHAAAQRVVLRGVSWDTYERLRHDLEAHSAPRLTYDEGTLEIMTLEGDGYHPAPQSSIVPLVTAAALTTLVRASAGKSQGEWWRLARQWARKTSE